MILCGQPTRNGGTCGRRIRPGTQCSLHPVLVVQGGTAKVAAITETGSQLQVINETNSVPLALPGAVVPTSVDSAVATAVLQAVTQQPILPIQPAGRLVLNTDQPMKVFVPAPIPDFVSQTSCFQDATAEGPVMVGHFNITADYLMLDQKGTKATFATFGGHQQVTQYNLRRKRLAFVLSEMLKTCDIVVTFENDVFFDLLNMLEAKMPSVAGIYCVESLNEFPTTDEEKATFLRVYDEKDLPIASKMAAFAEWLKGNVPKLEDDLKKIMTDQEELKREFLFFLERFLRLTPRKLVDQYDQLKRKEKMQLKSEEDKSASASSSAKKEASPVEAAASAEGAFEPSAPKRLLSETDFTNQTGAFLGDPIVKKIVKSYDTELKLLTEPILLHWFFSQFVKEHPELYASFEDMCGQYAGPYASFYSAKPKDIYISQKGIGIYFNPNKVTLEKANSQILSKETKTFTLDRKFNIFGMGDEGHFSCKFKKGQCHFQIDAQHVMEPKGPIEFDEQMAQKLVASENVILVQSIDDFSSGDQANMELGDNVGPNETEMLQNGFSNAIAKETSNAITFIAEERVDLTATHIADAIFYPTSTMQKIGGMRCDAFGFERQNLAATRASIRKKANITTKQLQAEEEQLVGKIQHAAFRGEMKTAADGNQVREHPIGDFASLKKSNKDKDMIIALQNMLATIYPNTKAPSIHPPFAAEFRITALPL